LAGAVTRSHPQGENVERLEALRAVYVKLRRRINRAVTDSGLGQMALVGIPINLNPPSGATERLLPKPH
jgi:hypothetical protein